MHECCRVSNLHACVLAAARCSLPAVAPSPIICLAADPDHELALDLYQRAAAMNDAEGLFSLAWMHARGLAVPANSTLARQMLDRALAAAPQPSYKVGQEDFATCCLEWHSNQSHCLAYYWCAPLSTMGHF